MYCLVLTGLFSVLDNVHFWAMIFFSFLLILLILLIVDWTWQLSHASSLSQRLSLCQVGHLICYNALNADCLSVDTTRTSTDLFDGIWTHTRIAGLIKAIHVSGVIDWHWSESRSEPLFFKPSFNKSKKDYFLSIEMFSLSEITLIILRVSFTHFLVIAFLIKECLFF